MTLAWRWHGLGLESVSEHTDRVADTVAPDRDCPSSAHLSRTPPNGQCGMMQNKKTVLESRPGQQQMGLPVTRNPKRCPPIESGKGVQVHSAPGVLRAGDPPRGWGLGFWGPRAVVRVLPLSWKGPQLSLLWRREWPRPWPSALWAGNADQTHLFPLDLNHVRSSCPVARVAGGKWDGHWYAEVPCFFSELLKSCGAKGASQRRNAYPGPSSRAGGTGGDPVTDQRPCETEAPTREAKTRLPPTKLEKREWGIKTDVLNV